ncbi:hypothetical protein ILYODFUR_001643 [Ilyodon furcidens]|uniref:Uncharacterized protein n=1 Tax=Ilyodon furcidens TaxID=33524 RepID=A0ABV0U2H1_9TELE
MQAKTHNCPPCSPGPTSTPSTKIARQQAGDTPRSPQHIGQAPAYHSCWNPEGRRLEGHIVFQSGGPLPKRSTGDDTNQSPALPPWPSNTPTHSSRSHSPPLRDVARTPTQKTPNRGGQPPYGALENPRHPTLLKVTFFYV